jgi:hypothetical protein
VVDANTTNFGEWLTNIGLEQATLKERGEGWSTWTAKIYQDGISTTKWYVFANPSCTWTELEQAAASVRNRPGSPYSVVFSRSQAPQLEPSSRSRLSTTFPEGSVVTLQRLYYSAAVNRNLRTSDLTAAENFVEQRVSFPGLPGPQPAIRSLVQWLRGELSTSQKVAVLLAPGGQGKTTVATQIFHHFTSKAFESTIPVLINRNAWARSQDLIDLDDVWRSGIRACYPDAGLTPEMFRSCLLLGTICPIFDGLDELCTINPSDFKPDEVVTELIATFEGNFDGRLLITSRRSFWEQYVSPSLHGKVIEIELHNFTKDERDDYLRRRFPLELSPQAQRRQDRAKLILERIASRVSTYRPSQHSQSASGWEPYKNIEALPFVVMLAADSADTDETDLAAAYGAALESADPLRGLLLAICKREQLRHGLPKELSAEAQLDLLENVAGEFGSEITDEELQLVLADRRLPSSAKDKFDDHSLIVRKRQAYQFTYDFVFDYLCASVLLRWLQGASDTRSAVSVLNICADQPGNLLEGTADLVLSVCGQAWVTLARGRYHALCEAKGLDRRWQAGMFHLVHAVAKRDAQQEERLKKLLEVLGGADTKSLSNVYLEGAIDNLDLRAVSFRNITFGNIEFASCRFDETTRMEDCTFSANLDFENCHGAGLLTITGGSTSVHARSALQREQVRGVDRRISTDQIEEAIRFVLWKFHRGAGLKSIVEDNIRSSAKSSFAFGEQVVDVLIKFGVLERFQSATRHNVKILAKSDVVQLVNNNYKRGRLKEAFDELVRRLVK